MVERVGATDQTGESIQALDDGVAGKFNAVDLPYRKTEVDSVSAPLCPLSGTYTDDPTKQLTQGFQSD